MRRTRRPAPPDSPQGLATLEGAPPDRFQEGRRGPEEAYPDTFAGEEQPDPHP